MGNERLIVVLVAVVLGQLLLGTGCEGDSSQRLVRQSSVSHAKAEGARKAEEEVKIVQRLSGDTLLLQVETTLPPTTEAIVTVERSYWAVGDSGEYSHQYLSERGPLSDFGKERQVKVADSIWREIDRKKNAEWQAIGATQKISKISDDIEVSVTLADDWTKKFVTSVSKPFGGKIPSKTPSLHPLELEVGHSYRLSEDTPLAPSLQPSNLPVKEMLSRFKRVPKGDTFKIVETSNKHPNPWYKVETKRGSGWFNSIALMGQKLEFVK